MLYSAGIRALGEENYIEEGECGQHQFVYWIKRAAWIGRQLSKRCFVDFAQKKHTFEVEPDGKVHLLTPNTDSIVDPALSAQYEGS